MVWSAVPGIVVQIVDGDTKELVMMAARLVVGLGPTCLHHLPSHQYHLSPWMGRVVAVLVAIYSACGRLVDPVGLAIPNNYRAVVDCDEAL